MPADLATAVLPVMDWRLSELPKSLPAEEVETILSSCDRTTVAGRRDCAILLQLARLGLRACDAAALTLDDFDWNEAVVWSAGAAAAAAVRRGVGSHRTTTRPSAARRCNCFSNRSSGPARSGRNRTGTPCGRRQAVRPSWTCATSSAPTAIGPPRVVSLHSAALDQARNEHSTPFARTRIIRAVLARHLSVGDRCLSSDKRVSETNVSVVQGYLGS